MKLLSKLPKLEDNQCAASLLRYCGVPKVNHLYDRTVSAHLVKTMAR